MRRLTKYWFIVFLVVGFLTAYYNHVITQERIEREHLKHIAQQTTNIENTDTSETNPSLYSGNNFCFDGFSDEERNNDADIFNDCLDDYLDDPEDEIRFPPEIFDASDD